VRTCSYTKAVEVVTTHRRADDALVATMKTTLSQAEWNLSARVQRERKEAESLVRDLMSERRANR
jgi:hypothetical protein